jgi:hypothetical protein
MKKQANELNRNVQKKMQKWPKAHEEMLNIPGHKVNTTQTYTKILPHH